MKTPITKTRPLQTHPTISPFRFPGKTPLSQPQLTHFPFPRSYYRFPLRKKPITLTREFEIFSVSEMAGVRCFELLGEM